MTWLFPSVIATLAGTLVLTAIYFYIYRYDRQKFLFIWGVGWLVYAARFIFMLFIVAEAFPSARPFLLVANQLCALCSGMFLLHGTFVFSKKETPRYWYFLSAATAVWIVTGSLLAVSFLWLALPTYFFLGMIYIWTGIVFLNRSPRTRDGRSFTGWAFILWGIHKMDYPFVRPITWLAPWGYLLGASLEIVLAVGMLLIYFNQSMRELQNSRDNLQLSEKRFKDLAENSTDWIWEFDENEKFTYASPRIKDLLGYTPEEIIGKSAFDLIQSSDRETVKEEFSNLKTRREPFSNLLNINQHKNGSLVILESSGVPIIDNQGNFFGYRGIDRDITERTRIEEQLRQAQKMEAIGTLAGGIAHDFNNILSAIFGYAEMARLDIKDPNRLEHDLDEILHGAERARALVKQILTFSRKTDQELQPLKLQFVVKEVLQLLRSTLPTNIDIKQDIDPDCPPVLADLTQIHQVVMNLCTNAYHAMRNINGTLSITLKSAENITIGSGSSQHVLSGRQTILEISDTGIGMPEKLQDKIFEPYFTTKEQSEGTGLGLAVVHGIIKSLGGHIEVKSKVGKGSTFRIFLAAIESSSPTALSMRSESLPTGNEKIMFVDDDGAIVSLQRQNLETLGYQVHGYTDSVEALHHFQNKPGEFDLIITDMTMPKMTGDELSRRILAIRPDIPIIMCTGFNERMDEEKARQAGVRKLLMKPLARKDLANTIRKAFDD